MEKENRTWSFNPNNEVDHLVSKPKKQYIYQLKNKFYRFPNFTW